ncbi:MAG: hypothetical protein PHS46_00790 [Candidatus Omnitrophica bacterium]|nr:hypothetical protein [Candidatus Omnitrophota bacterium]
MKRGIGILVIVMMTTAIFATQAHAKKAKKDEPVKDVVATVVCGKTEQVTPCVLILDNKVPSYELVVKNEGRDLCTIKADRIKEAWRVLGEMRREGFIEVIVDVKDGSYVVFNPRRPDLVRGIVPEGCAGLLIRTVEVKSSSSV